MAVFLLDASGDPDAFEALKERLAAAISDLAVIGNIGDVARREVGGGRAVALIAAPAQNREYFSRLLDIVTRYRGAVFFLLIGGDISASEYKALAQSGSADWVSDSAPLQEILDIVARQRGGGSPAPSAAAPRRPDVVSFLPSAGGVGNSTLATETALQLVRAKGGARRKVCLVDLDVQTSHVCDYLDIKPQLQIDELVRAPQRLDSHLLEMFCSRHDSGLHVFAAPRSRLRHVELNVEALDAFFERLAQSYDVIVVDLPVEWRPWTVHVLAASQGVLVTGLNVIPGLRQISETLAAIRSEPAIRGRVLVIVNRCEIGALGRVARRQHVDAVLGAEEKLFIRASRVVEECANTGAPMAIAYPSHKIVKEIAAIAKFCESVAARHGVKK